MTKQDTNETTLQFIAGFLNYKKGSFEKVNNHLDKILGSHDHLNDELTWFFKACVFKKMGKTEQSHDCLKMALMSFDYPPNITPPTIEFISSNSIQHYTPKLEYII